MDSSLNGIVRHLRGLYGRRNSIFLSSLMIRITFLNIAARDVQTVVRRNVGKDIIAIALARVFARVIAVADNFKELDITRGMFKKYPINYSDGISISYCSYCGSNNCKCPNERHSESKYLSRIGFVPSEIYSWKINHWCFHLEEIYGEKNKKKSIDSLVLRLYTEVSELMSLQALIPEINNTDEIEEQFSYEIADVIAWIIAIANYLNIDLEKAVLDRYGEGCWKCMKNPCNCGHFDFKQMDF